MPYTNNPHLPRVRMEAVRYIEAGHSFREAAAHFGYAPHTIWGWFQRKGRANAHLIPTRSSRPHHHPDELPESVIARILEIRKERDQCAEVIHHRLLQEGVLISLSSVKRTLKREGVTRFSKWKKWHTYPERPLATKPGVLVEIDTIMDGPADADRLYIYTALDVCSRFAFAEPSLRRTTHASWQFVKRMRDTSPFVIQLIQSDHGSEFSKWFSKQCLRCGIDHRHTRVRTPTDNAHLERFNLTIQRECLALVPRSLRSWSRAIPEFLHWYNTERPHMGLGMQTPLEVFGRY